MAFVVREAVAAGLGVEAASLLEVEGALAAGCGGGKNKLHRATFKCERDSNRSSTHTPFHTR